MLKKITIAVLTLSIVGVIRAGSDNERAKQLITELKDGTVSFGEVDWRAIDLKQIDKSLLEELRSLKMEYDKLVVSDKTAVEMPTTGAEKNRTMQTVIFSDDFAVCPGAWTTVDGDGAGYTWECATSLPYWTISPMGPVAGTFMLIDDDANDDDNYADELISPPIDCSQYTNITLDFDGCYNSVWTGMQGYDWLYVQVYDPGDMTWYSVVNFGDDIGFGAPEGPYDISAHADGRNGVQIRFIYNDDYWWAWGAVIDNVIIEGEPAGAGADIEVVSIDEPGTWGVDPDTVWAGATYQPVATVRNNGPSAARIIEVTCTCNGYVSVDTIDYLPNGNSTQVTFDDWTTDETPCNTYTMRVEASHPADNDPDNNWKEKQYINLADITVVSIDAPPDVVLTGTDYIPEATIQNSSTEGFATFDVHCTIEPGGYASTKPVSHLEYGTQTQVEFDTWTSFLSACSTYTMTVTVDISCDPNPDDNTLDKTIEATGDVGVTNEIVPTDSVFVDTKYYPTVTVTNFTQGMTEAFPCTLIIEDKDAKVIYFAEFVIDGLAPGEERDIIFDEWLVPPEIGELYTLYATSHLPCDDDTDNDMWEWTVKSVAKGAIDVGVLKINTPSSVKAGEAIKPDATVQNYGELEASFNVICQIQPSSSWQVYEDTAEVLALASGDTAKVVFKDWMPDTGSYIMWVKTFLIGDMNAANDSTVKTVNAVGIEEAEVPDKFDLSCIKPNPMSKQTVISYQLPVVSKVSLAIYDISGKLMKTLVSGHSSLGHYSAIWDGKDCSDKNVPAGIYFVRFETQEYKTTRKVVLLTR